MLAGYTVPGVVTGKPFDKHEVMTGVDEFLGGQAGMPLYYELEGDSVILHPTPASGYVTLAARLKIYTQRQITEIAVTAATSQPGFAIPFHRILSYACALDFTKDNQERQFLALQKERMEQGLIRYYSKRGAEIKTEIKPP